MNVEAVRCLGRHYAWLAVLVVTLLPNKGWSAELTFEAFFSSYPTPMLMIAVEDGDIIRANPAAVDFYGYPDIESMSIHEINTFTTEQLQEEIERASQQERNQLIFRHLLANGTTKKVGAYTRRYTIDGREVLLSSIYDMSLGPSTADERYVKTVEEQVDIQMAELRQARERARWFWLVGALAQALVIALLALALWRLRKAQRENNRLIDELSFRNRELERLSQAMAHHFQEPSRRLVSFAHQLQRRSASDSLDDTTQTAVHFIGTQAQRLSDLVSDVQRYLSVDAQPLAMERIAVQPLVERLYENDGLLSPLRQANALEIRGTLPDVYFNHKQLAMLFEMLLHNAWQYRHADRPLRVVISAQERKGRAVFSVADNGSGIAPEYRQQVFDMFARLVPNGEAYPGTGMGLAIAVKALRRVEGHITITDGIEGGACVVFDLPLPKGN